METPEEKSKQLISINSLTILSVVGNKLTMSEVKEIAKQFTLIEIDEIIEANKKIHISKRNIYWNKVKQETKNYESSNI